MKKITVCILIVAMMCTIALPTYSFCDISNNVKSFTYNGHGEFVTESRNMLLINEQTESELVIGNSVIATSVDGNEIYKINNSDKYLVSCSENKYLLSDKVEIDVENYENNFGNFELYEVSDYLKSDIENVICEQKLIGNEDFAIELYAPSLVTKDEGLSVMADEPLGTQYYTYNYNGISYNMKDYSVRYVNLNTGMIRKSGTSTLSTAREFASIIITSLDGVSEVANMFGTYLGVAMSAYDIFKNIRGEVISGTANDYISTNVIYVRIVKETYAQDPVYFDYPNAGCVTHKVWLDHNETYHYYQSKGEEELTNTSVNKEIYTPNFRNPAPLAIGNGISATHFDLPLLTNIYGTTVRLVGSY